MKLVDYIINALLAFISVFTKVPAPLPVEQPQPSMPKSTETPRDRLIKAARAALGKDMTPGDAVPDEVACVAQLVAIVPDEFGLDKKLTYTPALYEALKRNKRFKGSLDMKAGSIVVYPTTGTNTGHALICLEDDDGNITGHNTLASNNSFGSAKGLFTLNYNRKSARAYFIGKKGLKGYIFEPI